MKKNLIDQKIQRKKIDIADFLEKCRPGDNVIPGQAYSIRELLERSSRGQRLNIPVRPTDMIHVTDDTYEYDPKQDDSLDNNPPQLSDIIDFEEYRQAHQERKQQFEAKRREAAKAKKEPANPAPVELFNQPKED